MQDRQLYAEILGIKAPWFVEQVELKLAEGEVHVRLDHHDVRSWPAQSAASRAVRTTTSRSGTGGTWTRANSGPFSMPSHPAQNAASMGFGWCSCPGRNREAGSRRCLSDWRSTG